MTTHRGEQSPTAQENEIDALRAELRAALAERDRFAHENTALRSKVEGFRLQLSAAHRERDEARLDLESATLCGKETELRLANMTSAAGANADERDVALARVRALEAALRDIDSIHKIDPEGDITWGALIRETRAIVRAALETKAP